jgi:exosortase/archaeosortase family protein
VGTKIIIHHILPPDRVLSVAEACAGLRSLMTFISVAATIAFLSSRPLWQKLIITASAVPIAIFCNVMRVAGQGLLDHYVSEELSQSYAHQFVGLVMLVPAFFLILLVGWIVDHIFIEEVEEKKASPDRIKVKRPAGGSAAKTRGASAPVASSAEPIATAPRRPGLRSNVEGPR